MMFYGKCVGCGTDILLGSFPSGDRVVICPYCTHDTHIEPISRQEVERLCKSLA